MGNSAFPSFPSERTVYCLIYATCGVHIRYWIQINASPKVIKGGYEWREKVRVVQMHVL